MQLQLRGQRVQTHCHLASRVNRVQKINRSRTLVVVRAEEGAEENGADEGNVSLMSMADSLIERAKEVAASGVVDDDFKTVYVKELEAELQSLVKRASEAEAQAATMEESLKGAKDMFVRLQADFENFRKRTATERETLTSNAKGDVISGLLPVIDNFELAKSQLKVESEGEIKIDNAYQGLYKQLVEAFRGMGLEAVPGQGSLFDPELHEAIMREPNEDVPEGTVLEEFRKGFRLGEKLLRPAMVKVSYSDAPAASSTEESD